MSLPSSRAVGAPTTPMDTSKVIALGAAASAAAIARREAMVAQREHKLTIREANVVAREVEVNGREKDVASQLSDVGDREERIKLARRQTALQGAGLISLETTKEADTDDKEEGLQFQGQVITEDTDIVTEALMFNAGEENDADEQVSGPSPALPALPRLAFCALTPPPLLPPPPPPSSQAAQEKADAEERAAAPVTPRAPRRTMIGAMLDGVKNLRPGSSSSKRNTSSLSPSTAWRRTTSCTCPARSR